MVIKSIKIFILFALFFHLSLHKFLNFPYFLYHTLLDHLKNFFLGPFNKLPPGLIVFISGLTVVPGSEVPSAFLLQQLIHVSTPKGRKKGNRKNTIQEPLVAFRVNLDRGCDVPIQPMALKKNGRIIDFTHYNLTNKAELK